MLTLDECNTGIVERETPGAIGLVRNLDGRRLVLNLTSVGGLDEGGALEGNLGFIDLDACASSSNSSR
jgi:hypothetical protein